MKVLLKLFQKLATGCGGEEPPQNGGNVAQRQKEDPPTVWGECHEVTKGDGLRERTARVAGEEPPQVKGTRSVPTER